MRISKAEITRQFDRAKLRGWIPHFIEAAETITKNYFDAADLMAIASRETNLDPRWLTKAGDRGNGFGLMQIDRRSFPEFTGTDKWKDARLGILYGAKVLMQKWRDYEANVGKVLQVKSSKGGVFTYEAKRATGQTAQKIVISSYNCGRWAQFAFSRGQDIDRYSTGHDYAADVMARAVEFRKLLNPFFDLRDDEIQLEIPENFRGFDTSSAAAVQQAATSEGKTSVEPLETPAFEQQPPPMVSENQAVESKTAATTETAQGTVEQTVAVVNEQPVSEPAAVTEPPPQGFMKKLGAGIATLMGGTLVYDSLGRLSGIQFTMQTVGIICFIVFLAFLGFCLWAVLETVKQNKRTELEALAKTDPRRKDLVWVKPEERI